MSEAELGKYKNPKSRLFVKSTFVGFRMGKSTQNENHALLRIDGVQDRKDTRFYMGKRVCYVYRTSHGFKVNLICSKFYLFLFIYQTKWGRIGSPHGNNGVVKAAFPKNMPPRAIGATLRVMLYPVRPL